MARHQVEQVAVTSNEIVGPGGDGEVQIGSVLRVAFEAKLIRHVAQVSRMGDDGFKKSLSPFGRGVREVFKYTRAGQNLRGLRQRFARNEQPHPPAQNQPETLRGRARWVEKRLDEKVAVEDDADTPGRQRSRPLALFLFPHRLPL